MNDRRGGKRVKAQIVEARILGGGVRWVWGKDIQRAKRKWGLQANRNRKREDFF